MKCLKTFIICQTFYIIVQAQPSVQPLVKAENDFEQLSHKEGLKTAFVFFADPRGITFSDSGAVNARQFWNARPGGGGFFSWAPSYAEVSDGGDWGYTTGAAQFRRKSLQDTVAFSSQYTTVWHKEASGNWKYLMDIGIGHASVPPDTICKKIFVKKIAGREAKDSLTVLEADKTFNNAIIANAKDAYAKFGGRHYLLNNERYFISSSIDSAAGLLNKITLTCTSTGVFVAPNGDMAFVYGRVRRDATEANYVRIWRHELKGWKVAVEVFQ